jgi:putative methionine-R-sulfoxide reductase with GAF domain
MAKVVADSGRAFDPRVVEILRRRYIELEKMANEQPLQAPPKLSTDIKIERGLAPDAGFAESADAPTETLILRTHAKVLLSAAHQRGQEIVDLSRLGATLSIADIASLLSVRLTSLVPYDSMAVYALKDGELAPEFVSGENFRLFASLRIPLGEGLSGWVAQNNKAILNGNPSVEPGYLNDPTKYSTLRSALAVPLAGSSGVLAVLALYRSASDGFTPEDQKLTEAVVRDLGKAIEESTKLKAAGTGAGK